MTSSSDETEDDQRRRRKRKVRDDEKIPLEGPTKMRSRPHALGESLRRTGFTYPLDRQAVTGFSPHSLLGQQNNPNVGQIGFRHSDDTDRNPEQIQRHSSPLPAAILYENTLGLQDTRQQTLLSALLEVQQQEQIHRRHSSDAEPRNSSNVNPRLVIQHLLHAQESRSFTNHEETGNMSQATHDAVDQTRRFLPAARQDDRQGESLLVPHPRQQNQSHISRGANQVIPNTLMAALTSLNFSSQSTIGEHLSLQKCIELSQGILPRLRQHLGQHESCGSIMAEHQQNRERPNELAAHRSHHQQQQGNERQNLSFNAALKDTLQSASAQQMQYPVDAAATAGGVARGHEYSDTHPLGGVLLQYQTEASKSMKIGKGNIVQIPCKARGMDFSHNPQSAYFCISITEIKHGDELSCSHAGCRENGVRFLYCAYCEAPVAKGNFSSRHSHKNTEWWALQQNHYIGTAVSRNEEMTTNASSSSSGEETNDDNESTDSQRRRDSLFTNRRRNLWLSLLDSKPNIHNRTEMSDWLSQVLDVSDPTLTTPPPSDTPDHPHGGPGNT